MTSFGLFVKQEREKRGWTQTDFGAKLGINSAKISRIENNKDSLSPSKLPVLSELFKISLNKIKDFYLGDKFAKEAYKIGCSKNTFEVADKTYKYYLSQDEEQGKIEFN